MLDKPKSPCLRGSAYRGGRRILASDTATASRADTGGDDVDFSANVNGHWDMIEPNNGLNQAFYGGFRGWDSCTYCITTMINWGCLNMGD